MPTAKPASLPPRPSPCPLCDAGSPRPAVAPYALECTACGYLWSNLEPVIADKHHAEGELLEGERLEGLERLRKDNAGAILDRLGSLEGLRVLDVGTAHGWFLEAAAERGAEIAGIEPDRELYEFARDRGLPVRHGFFPDDLAADERYDLIVFNDVLEHIPGPLSVLRACRERLAQGGRLVINGPSRGGVFFRLARWAHRLGWSSLLDRMWQKGLPSPHVSYFRPDALRRGAERVGLEEIDRFPVPSLRLSGLRQRLAYAGSLPTPVIWVLWAGLVVAYPLLRILPQDIWVQVFTPAAAGSGDQQ